MQSHARTRGSRTTPLVVAGTGGNGGAEEAAGHGQILGGRCIPNDTLRARVVVIKEESLERGSRRR